MKITLSPGTILRVMATAVFVLLLGYAVTQSLLHLGGHRAQWGLLRLFDLNGENNIPSWYASSSLLFCSFLLTVIGVGRKQIGDRSAGRWFILATIFLYISIDEAASIHEMAIAPVRARLNPTGYLFHAWVIPGTLVVIVLSLAHLRFLLRLPSEIRQRFLAAAAVYLGGALGGEFLSGQYWSLYGGAPAPGHSVLAVFEEGLEMVGVLIFVYGLYSYLGLHVKNIDIEIGPGPRGGRVEI